MRLAADQLSCILTSLNAQQKRGEVDARRATRMNIKATAEITLCAAGLLNAVSTGGDMRLVGQPASDTREVVSLANLSARGICILRERPLEAGSEGGTRAA